MEFPFLRMFFCLLRALAGLILLLRVRPEISSSFAHGLGAYLNLVIFAGAGFLSAKLPVQHDLFACSCLMR
jgi:hypothetical protein